MQGRGGSPRKSLCQMSVSRPASSPMSIDETERGIAPKHAPPRETPPLEETPKESGKLFSGSSRLRRLVRGSAIARRNERPASASAARAFPQGIGCFIDEGDAATAVRGVHQVLRFPRTS